MKNSGDTIGNRTRDLPVCSAVPKPAAPPRALPLSDVHVYYKLVFVTDGPFRLCKVTRHSGMSNLKTEFIN
jgi:hypothetical protein